MNLLDVGLFKVIIDYGHNIGAIKATGEMIPYLGPGKKIRMAAGTGNRRAEDIIEYGKTLSRYYDHIIITDTDPRNMAPGEVPDLVKKGILSTGFSEEEITIIPDGREATIAALKMAHDGDIVVLQADDVKQVIADVMEYKEKLSKSFCD